MNGAVPTLRQFFAFSELSPDKLMAIELIPKMLSLRTSTASKAPAIGWPATLGEVIKQIGGLLEVPIPEIATAAWNKYRVLRKYTDGKKFPADRTFLVPLTRHTIKSAHKPYVEILVGQEVVGRIDFDISLELTLEGVLLKIRNGKIVELQIGSCTGRGAVRCENFLILEKESASFALPGSIALGAGLPIPR